ncbi:hypothetical protein SAMN05444004_101531 [Jannaschia faecimaris]|uniref:Sulfotransferase family protein n=1 Tax=Jannaschia faecimaris TaxID=1244108 RepID=A0A1H3K5U4_9RHOB|nr:hypothetical protein [Jannaschia faecimaris]SDY47533.1 hypothetical protein SAMN05444004_101531 [Jannaschia faecimaris]
MPRLIVHAGIHKTGTTTLQKTLHANRTALQRQGILYPETGLLAKPNTWGHHDLAYALRNADRGRDIWTALRAEADGTGQGTVVVSSEELSLLPFPRLPGMAPYKIIAECFSGWDITLLCYLRPQADVVASLYNHQVKSVGEAGDVFDFLPRVSQRLEYANYLNLAAAGLGVDAIRVRRYGRTWMRGDILDDVAGEIGLDLSQGIVRAARDLNPGLTRSGLEAMLAANRRYTGDPGRLLRERRRILSKHAAAAEKSHDALSPDMRRTITALYHTKNVQVGRRFLKLDGNLFNPDVQPLRPVEA